MFETNVGTIDRVIRLIIGIGLLGFGIFLITGGSTLGYILAIVSIIPLGTALLSTCPIYSLLGMSTCPMETKA